MRTETLLDALEKVIVADGAWYRRYRQHLAFRAAILARDEDQRERIAVLEAEVEYWRDGNNGAIREREP